MPTTSIKRLFWFSRWDLSILDKSERRQIGLIARKFLVLFFDERECRKGHSLSGLTLKMNEVNRMAGKIFYRERIKLQDGAKNPRFRVVAASGIDLKVYANHLRKSELEQIARETGAELIELQRGPKHQDKS